MKRFARLLVFLAILLFLPVLWLATQIQYASQIAPKGIRNIADHYQRFGAPPVIFEIHGTKPGEPYFEFYGFPGGKSPTFAFPSCPPSYIYNHQGKFVTWCFDPGDNKAHWERWTRITNQHLDPETIRKQFVP